jgi:LysM repeat protein
MMRRLLRVGLVTTILCLLFGQSLSALAQNSCGSTVTVGINDNLVQIARRCAVTLEALLAANPQITDPNRLLVGQVLNIPAGDNQNPSVPPHVVAIYPLSGAPGTSITVIANGFPANTPVNIMIGRQNASLTNQYQATTDSDGGLQAVVTIPISASEGQGWLVTVATLDGGIDGVSLPFRVLGQTSLPTPTANAVLFDRANIYLIALEDGGRSGQAIGCGDSVIAVQRTIQPTVAPLTSALEILLSLNDQFYGESGLYNALYQSDLRLEGINIVNREAIINLSGQLVLNGTCDAPRVRAQLEQTALQYRTVDRVSITINGQPIDELLSSQG